jgi:CRISPR/Cas system-associated exonuclease Cas4 (RecB family)
MFVTPLAYCKNEVLLLSKLDPREITFAYVDETISAEQIELSEAILLFSTFSRDSKKTK